MAPSLMLSVSTLRTALVRQDDPVLMARFVWAVVHGAALLAIDAQLREPGSVEALMRYTLERLGTGIEVDNNHQRQSSPTSDAGTDGRASVSRS